MSDDESAEFKDVDSDVLTKFDNALGAIAGIKLDYVDFKRNSFNDTFIVPHIRITVPQSQLPSDLAGQLRYRFSEIDMSLDDVGMDSETVQVSKFIEREFAIRVRFKDSEITNPARFIPNNYEGIRSVLDRAIVDRIESLTPEVDPTEFRVIEEPKNLTVENMPEYTVTKEDYKEMWYKLSMKGLEEDPFSLQDYLRELVPNSIVAEVSVNEFTMDGLNVFPLGWLDLQKYIDDATPGPEQEPQPATNQFTGTVILSDLSPEAINNLYSGDEPDTKRMNDAIKGLFKPLENTDIESLRVDYYEPIDESTAIGHFLFVQRDDSAKTSSDIVDVLDNELTNVPGDINARLSDPELSTTRRFKAHVTTPLSNEELVARLQNETAAEFDDLTNFKSINGKTYFDIETDRNIGVQTDELATAIDDALGSTDAVVEIPGGNLLPLRQWIATIYVNVEAVEAQTVLADWTGDSASGTSLMSKMSDWQLDYNSAFNASVIQLFVFAEFPFNTPRANLESIFNEQTQIAEYLLEYPRKFTGRCSYAPSDTIPDGTAVNKTIMDLAIGMTIAFPPVTTITITYIELTGENGMELYNPSNRRRRQADDEQPIMFKFSGGKNERLVPKALEQQGRAAIQQNPTLANILDSSSLIIEPDMYDPEKEPPTIPPTLEPETTETTTLETTTIKLITKPSVMATIPQPKLTGVVVYEVNNPDITDGDLAIVEDNLNDHGKEAQCQTRPVGDKSFVECRVKVDSEDTLDNIDIPSISPEKVFIEDDKYIEEDGAARCSNRFLNDCHNDADCDDSTGSIMCTCKQGFEDEVSILNKTGMTGRLTFLS